jgi:hypothetical protein
MDAPARAAIEAPIVVVHPPRLGIVAVLLLVGLAGHVLAARMIGSGIAYRDHIAGFFVIAAVTGLPLLGLERLFWRGRRDVTLLIFAALQALFGIVIYFLRPGVH